MVIGAANATGTSVVATEDLSEMRAYRLRGDADGLIAAGTILSTLGLIIALSCWPLGVALIVTGLLLIGIGAILRKTATDRLEQIYSTQKI